MDLFRIRARFLPPHRAMFAGAIAEIDVGRKVGHWSWYLFPSAPHVVHGVERGSPKNREFALRDLPPNTLVGVDAAAAYIALPPVDGVSLRRNYIAMMDAVSRQLERGVSPLELVGSLDDPKLRSSLRLFAALSKDGVDPEVHRACMRCLRLLREE